MGTVPDLDSEVGMAALDSAKNAYDHGRGAWPTAPAGERIVAMEKFIALILPRRPAVGDRLTWEIGTQRRAAEKEVDRTVDEWRGPRAD